jgi:hypothetical protein
MFLGKLAAAALSASLLLSGASAYARGSAGGHGGATAGHGGGRASASAGFGRGNGSAGARGFQTAGLRPGIVNSRSFGRGRGDDFGRDHVSLGQSRRGPTFLGGDRFAGDRGDRGDRQLTGGDGPSSQISDDGGASCSGAGVLDTSGSGGRLPVVIYGTAPPCEPTDWQGSGPGVYYMN